MAAGDFLTIGTQAIPVQRTGAEWAPDGANGKRRWTVTTAPMDAADVAVLRAAIGVGSGAAADRSVSGTLLTDRPLLACTGQALSADGTDTVLCEVTIERAAFRHHRASQTTADVPTVRHVLSLTLREA
jgi:hypothetical protein